MWEFILNAGESTPIHEHRFDYLFYPINGAPLEVFSESGNSLGIFDATEGNTFAFKVEIWEFSVSRRKRTKSSR